ncbi:MAG: ROK family protein [Xanthobacteraceae bacterium]|nr:ROK family protein [Xanthobacteraceae bacterium]
MPERRGLRIGFDVGGTKIAICVLDAAGNYVFKNETATPRDDYPAFLEAAMALLKKSRDAVPEAAHATIGAGIPGEIDVLSNTVKNANSTCLIGHNLEADLERVLGQKVRLANDAQCLIASEVHDGAAKGAAVAFGVILGTGVGGGVAVNGEPWRGNNRLAGEWGHNPFPDREGEATGSPCYCGRNNCIETVLSGPALVAAYHDATAGENAQLPEIEAKVAEGDPVAGAVLSEYIDKLGQALATVVGVLDPEVIVLGGGVSSITAIYRELPERVSAHMFHSGISKPRFATRIVKSKWGPDSGVRGAARLWPLPR